MKKRNRNEFISFKIKSRRNEHSAYKLNLIIPVILALVMATWSAGWAISGEYVEVKTVPLKEALETTLNWHVTAYQSKDAGTNYRTAKICFWHDPEKKDQYCFMAEDDHLGKEKHYTYYLVKDLKIIPLKKGKEPIHGILFVAENRAFSAGGFLIFSCIWSYNQKQEKFIKILPSIRITDQGEFRVFHTLKNGVEGVFVKADYVWGEGEGRYDYHRYKIQIYKLGEEGIFRMIGGYVTKIKYNSDVATIDVIEHELKNIEKYISNKMKK